MLASGIGYKDRALTDAELRETCEQAVSTWALAGKRVLVIIPDHTRTCPTDKIFCILYEKLANSAALLDFLVALGTHPPMSQEHIYQIAGISEYEHRNIFPKARFFNHMWKDPDQLISVGNLSSKDIGEITNGLFEMDVTITCNKMVRGYDTVIIMGPVFPHEVVGFSGGNKYLFPGIAGQEIIDFFHWLGAVITNTEIIGTKHTPVRKVIDRASSMIKADRKAICLVMEGETPVGVYCGTPEEAWSNAADLSAQVNIEYKDKPYHTVLSCAPEMYDDLWTGGKCMYKIEPIVAYGGKVIIYAPHITDISPVHGTVLHEIGYHTRDYFLAQWDKFKGYPWGVVAHSTHVKGAGTYEDGVEKPRVEVILATGIPEDICRKVNLAYMDYRTIDKEEYAGREDEGILLVRKAGEVLYRLRR